MRRNKLIDRLSKLVALESSPNTCEADNARRAAERLMARHGLSRSDVVARETGYHEVEMPRGWGEEWRFVLATAAARHRGAEAVRRGGRVRICGEHVDVESARALARRLLRTVREVEVAAADVLASDLGVDVSKLDDTVPRRQRDLAFRLGAARGVGRALARARAGEHVPAEGGPPARSGPSPREVAVRPGSGRDHSARVAARHRPEVVSPRGDGQGASWEAFGSYVADRCVVALPDGVVEVRRSR